VRELDSGPGPGPDSDRERIGELARVAGVAIDEDAVRRLLQYRDYLVELNPRYSIISPRDEARVVGRHFADSIELLRWIPDGPVRVLDFGSGGGLPGIVIAVLRPESRVILLEARHRKQIFLRLVTTKLPVPNARVAGTVGELPPEDGPPFDRVAARAIGSLRSLAREVGPLIREGGLLVAPKGSRGDAELGSARAALERAGLWLVAADTDRLTALDAERIDRPTFVFEKRAPAQGLA
jgi:16S rRNA (guanine527-N7)-methyltransferase